ncbi:MAG: NRAMP family divalent metal transporter [Thermoplasmata archaeon]
MNADLVENRRNKKGFYFLTRIGPAWIVMIADVDVASIITGLQSGATFGYRMIFIMLILIPPLFIVQNASGRLGIASGMGIGSAVRKRWDKNIAMMASIPMAATDFLSYIAEYSGIAIGFYLIGVPPILSVPAAFAVHNMVVIKGKYRRLEKLLMFVSVAVILSIIISAILMKPDITDIVKFGLSPLQPYSNRQFDLLMVANIGAVVMPFMLFYQAGASVEKHLKENDLKISRNETFIGAIVSEVLMVMIVIAGTAIGAYATDPRQLQNALYPFGSIAPVIEAIGFITAGFLALIVISLASTWGVAEALGWNYKMGYPIRGQKNFYILYFLESFPAAIIAIAFGYDLLNLIIDLMIVFVIVLAPVGVLLGLLIKDKNIMGEKRFGNGYMAIYWIMLAVIEISGVYSLVISL